MSVAVMLIAFTALILFVAFMAAIGLIVYLAVGRADRAARRPRTATPPVVRGREAELAA